MKIKTADIKIKLDKIGADVVRKSVTTAEAAILTAEHHKRAGGVPIEILPATEKEAELSGTALYSHLVARYGARRVKNLYPSPTGRYPETFDEAIELGMATVSPTEKLMEFTIN